MNTAKRHYRSGIDSRDILMIDGVKKRRPFSVMTQSNRRHHRARVETLNQKNEAISVEVIGEVIDHGDYREFVYKAV
jgi:hypothetical protein